MNVVIAMVTVPISVSTWQVLIVVSVHLGMHFCLTNVIVLKEVSPLYIPLLHTV